MNTTALVADQNAHVHQGPLWICLWQREKEKERVLGTSASARRRDQERQRERQTRGTAISAKLVGSRDTLQLSQVRKLFFGLFATERRSVDVLTPQGKQ